MIEIAWDEFNQVYFVCKVRITFIAICLKAEKSSLKKEFEVTLGRKDKIDSPNSFPTFPSEELNEKLIWSDLAKKINFVIAYRFRLESWRILMYS